MRISFKDASLSREADARRLATASRFANAIALFQVLQVSLGKNAVFLQQKAK
ncbi:hypothetical protein I8748_30480 [Nostoc sp. CENA67]|uniref:Uncharacterized protein n=1 Tax=Amazonocrinis nigriterrae CENA67 TaxID=2794033 RepID=A0A8J7I192_9NOST|nr:hypothetical protein [Amazonocrinis nigriterrae]MBH8566429.1 hypothetical protein [Amazonocrinis nigriterrae CENA67]